MALPIGLGAISSTKFDMGKSVFLPYNDVWFGVPPGAPHGRHPSWVSCTEPDAPSASVVAGGATFRNAG
jgi:hypothetical protein